MYNWTIPGIASIGPKRELKFAVEKFWRREISTLELESCAVDIRNR